MTSDTSDHRAMPIEGPPGHRRTICWSAAYRYPGSMCVGFPKVLAAFRPHAGDLVFLGDRRRLEDVRNTMALRWRPGAHQRADPILKVPDGYADSAVARGRPHRGTCDVRARVPGLANSSSLPAPHTQTCCLRWTLRPGCGRRPGEPDLLAGPGPCGDCLNGQSSPPC